ncbi:winged helix-turn-helix domain-containing tetratricopeptide repeat protein [Glaciecola sp. 1036]|uniref:winged helix-turn-helix domain-containing tetratricopeptide repeat protein n=1 Tax=Alteromonadaceae TaxID=72275 RepID=UPI003D04F0FF
MQEFSVDKWRVYPLENRIDDGENSVKIEPKAMELLVVLAKAEGNLVTRDQIFEQVWKHQVIADHVLYNLIANLRKAMEPNPHKPSFIITVPKKGYRLAQQVSWQQASPVVQTQTAPPTKKSSPVAWLAMLGILSVVAVFWFINQSSNQLEVIESETEQPQTPTQTAIAVLPFQVFDDEADTRFFADGLAEEIIHQLASAPDLSVISRSSSFSFKDQTIDSQSLAKKLGVNYLLEGAVRKEGNTLRINTHLINAQDATHVWSKVFTAEEQSLFKLQQDISIAIVTSLEPENVSITRQKFRQHPESGDAYMHFLRGNAMAARATPEYTRKALAEFEKAIELEPDYALAHASIALNTLVLFQQRVITAEDTVDPTLKAIETALQINPFLPEAIVAKGLFHSTFNQRSEAEQAFEEALSLDPNSALAHHNYGYLLWINQDYSGALKHFSIALTYNPMSAITNFAVADSLFSLGQLEKALAQYIHCTELLPDYPACHLGIANLYRFTLQYDKVDKHMAKAKTYLSDRDFYLYYASLTDATWRDELPQANNLAAILYTHNGGTYIGLQIKLILASYDNNLDQWLENTLALKKEWPDSQSLPMALGLYYYFQNDCSTSTDYYETVLSDNPQYASNFNVMIWGVSHIANLAYCYKQTEQNEKYSQMMTLLDQQLSTYQLKDFTVPGVALTTLRYKVLSESSAVSDNQLEQLKKTNKVLDFLISQDPIFQATN